jgi:quercetin dioxygenase-like cupin family protein
MDMKCVHYSEVPAENPAGDTKGVTVRWLISEEDGAPHFYMRLFEIAPGGYSPLHRHEWEHEIYVLSGNGEAVGEEERYELRPGTVLYILPRETHQLRNTGDRLLRFLCLVPSTAE